MLIADRFTSLNGRTLDLASGELVVFRRLPGGDRASQVAWSDRCAACNPDRPPASAARLIDYGLLNDGDRFEAYRAGGANDGRTARFTVAADARTGNARVSTETVVGPSSGPGDAFLQQLEDLLAAACYGEPHRLWLPTVGAPALLDFIARQGRLSGFVPVSLALLLNADRWHAALAAELHDTVRTRHLLIMVREPILCTGRGWCAAADRAAGPGPRQITPCPIGVARVMLGAGTCNARPNLLVAVGPSDAGAATLPRCLSHDAGALCGSVRWNAPAVDRTVAVARRSPVAAEAHESYRVAGSSDLLRVRAQAAMIGRARGGQARIERGLRRVMGALSRRDDPAGTANVALRLGRLLLARGRALDAARTFEAARTQFDRASDLPGAVRAAIYLGLAWTDEGRLAEAEAACRMAHMAAEQAGLGALSLDARLALARCLYWRGRFDEATVLTSLLADLVDRAPLDDRPASIAEDGFPAATGERATPVVRDAAAIERWGEPTETAPIELVPTDEGSRSVRIVSLGARLSLAAVDLPRASAHALRAVELAAETGAAIDDCVARTALAAVRAALHDGEAVVDQVRAGLRAARRAQAPLGALRLRLLACDTLRLAGRQADAARLHRHLAALDPARFPALLRARLQIVLVGEGRVTVACPSLPSRPFPQALVAASCPWRLEPARRDVAVEITAVLQVCHEVEDEEAALGRVCDALRERTRAVAVGLVGRNGQAAALLARSGPGAGRSTLVDRVLDTGTAVVAVQTSFGLEAAAPVRYAGLVIGAVACRWPADAIVDAGRAGCLLTAAAAASAPHVRSLLDREAPRTDGADGETAMVGVSGAIQALRKAASRAAAAPFAVLIEGESGSGKELVARAIHRDSPRRVRRFCALNCAALTDELVEAELFGHVRGAFTGAVTDRVGLFEEADGGTLFLDEVADLSARAQAKLLRAVQDGEVRRVGENFARHVDTRVIAATNRRLDAEVAGGTFRRDLFYRLNVVHIDVPPLRDRPEDVAVLAAHFWLRSTTRVGSRATLAPNTIAVLARYDWPGNVRELQNVMAALAVSAPRRGSVGPGCLPAAIARAGCGGAATLEDARRLFERRFVQAALARAAGHRGRAAAALGLSRQGLAKLIVRLGLEPQEDD